MTPGCREVVLVVLVVLVLVSGAVQSQNTAEDCTASQPAGETENTRTDRSLDAELLPGCSPAE